MGFLMNALGLSERRSCRIVGLSRSVQQYQPPPKNDVAVVGRLKEEEGQQVRTKKRRGHSHEGLGRGEHTGGLIDNGRNHRP